MISKSTYSATILTLATKSIKEFGISWHKKAFSKQSEQRVRNGFLIVAGLIFAIELGLFFAHQINLNFIPERFVPKNFLDTINAPLTLILVYEIYLLVASTSHSIIEFISKQFEVITLIILRSVFKDLSHLSTYPDITLATPLVWTIGISLVGSLFLYFLIEVFQRFQQQFSTRELSLEPQGLTEAKQQSTILLSVFVLAVTLYYGTIWIMGTGTGFEINYFKQIFSLLIIFDVVLLILSMHYFNSFELLFEYSALILASVLVLIAIPLAVPAKLVLVSSALIFCIGTVRLHSFVRENELVNRDHS